MHANIVKPNDGEIYSTTETLIGTFEGENYYRQMVYVSSFPNATSKTITFSRSGKSIKHIWGMMQGGYCFQFPNAQDQLWYEPANSAIFIVCSTDRSALSGYIVIEYTKT